ACATDTRPFFTSIAVCTSIASDDDVGGLDDGIDVVAAGEPQILDRFVGDRGGHHGAPGNPDADVGRGRALLHLEDLPLENVARAELHAVLLDASAISPSIASGISGLQPARLDITTRVSARRAAGSRSRASSRGRSAP